jgi:hypothetical protein
MSHYKGAKQNTIGVTKGTNIKLSHHRGLVLTYPMENETPLVPHAVSNKNAIV